jgi:hypothetical protein
MNYIAGTSLYFIERCEPFGVIDEVFSKDFFPELRQILLPSWFNLVISVGGQFEISPTNRGKLFYYYNNLHILIEAGFAFYSKRNPYALKELLKGKPLKLRAEIKEFNRFHFLTDAQVKRPILAINQVYTKFGIDNLQSALWDWANTTLSTKDPQNFTRAMSFLTFTSVWRLSEALWNLHERTPDFK